MITNTFELEGLIKTKITTDVTALTKVSSMLDVNEKSILQFHPAAYVIYAGYSIASDSPRGRQGTAILIDQKWIIALVIQNAEGVLAGDKVKNSAGDLMYKIIKSLNGIKLGADYSEMKLVNPGQLPKYYPGTGVFPIGFECRFTIKGD